MEERPAPTIWHALNSWAKTLKAWQRHILVRATEQGRLTDNDIDNTYGLFLEETGLADKQERAEVEFNISGRPTAVLSAPLCLDRIDGLSGVNALPNGSSLCFGPGLTIVYGRNGAGKSGFARLLAHAGFSRGKLPIIPNIYAEQRPLTASATFHFQIGGRPQEPFTLSLTTQHPELKRISVFDTPLAQQRLSQSVPFEFKPVGFDIFPEMARVYGELDERLSDIIRSRTHTTDFSTSFIGSDTDVSKAVARLGQNADLDSLRSLALYGDAEKARFQEVDRQLTALKTQSPAELISQTEQAKADIETLRTKLIALDTEFALEEAVHRDQLSREAADTAKAAAAIGTDTFKRPFFKAVGTPEWQSFAKAAHLLARQEHVDYPTSEDRCLLCERPFDDNSRAHVSALLAFVEGEAQQAADAAATALERETTRLGKLDIAIFGEDSRVRAHVRRLNPAIEASVSGHLDALAKIRDSAIAQLRDRTAGHQVIDGEPIVLHLHELLIQIDNDLMRLRSSDSVHAIAALELERQTLRHREVLSQLLPSIEAHVRDANWCARAEQARSLLNPKPITNKEKELFAEIIGPSYRKKLEEECHKLDCVLPIELQTVGQKGQTVRSLKMKGGHRPENILSEGEQKAVALADFLTEVGLNPTSAGIVLDDPVTSQDHERKARIATRLVAEATRRQVIIFTHDMPFLNMLITEAESVGVDLQTHWIDRSVTGKPGEISLNDLPSTGKQYETTGKAKRFLEEAKRLAGSSREAAIRNGMSALRSTIEVVVAKKLLKDVVGRWSDRVMVTALAKINWDQTTVDELVGMYEELSRWIEAHSHTDEAAGAPPEIRDLEKEIAKLEALIGRAKRERKRDETSTPAPVASIVRTG